jgi:hypothetical protein
MYHRNVDIQLQNYSVKTRKTKMSILGGELSPRGTPATTGLLYQPRMINDRGALVIMKIGRGNRSALRKSTPVPLPPLRIPQYLTFDLTP